MSNIEQKIDALAKMADAVDVLGDAYSHKYDYFEIDRLAKRLPPGAPHCAKMYELANKINPWRLEAAENAYPCRKEHDQLTLHVIGEVLRQRLKALPAEIAAERKKREAEHKQAERELNSAREEMRTLSGQSEALQKQMDTIQAEIEKLQSQIAKPITEAQARIDAATAANDLAGVKAASEALAKAEAAGSQLKIKEKSAAIELEALGKMQHAKQAGMQQQESALPSLERKEIQARARMLACDADAAVVAMLPAWLQYASTAKKAGLPLPEHEENPFELITVEMGRLQPCGKAVVVDGTNRAGLEQWVAAWNAPEPDMAAIKRYLELAERHKAYGEELESIRKDVAAANRWWDEKSHLYAYQRGPSTYGGYSAAAMPASMNAPEPTISASMDTGPMVQQGYSVAAHATAAQAMATRIASLAIADQVNQEISKAANLAMNGHHADSFQ